jgi:hypothetical protein
MLHARGNHTVARFKLKVNAKRLQRGQSLVEMSIGFVLLLTILSGVLDFGRAYYIFVALEDSAGEAALFLSMKPECRTAADTTASVDCSGDNNAETRAKKAGGSFIDWGRVEVLVDRPGTTVGERVTVRIRYTFPLLTPIVPRVAGLNPITLTATATQIIIGGE